LRRFKDLVPASSMDDDGLSLQDAIDRIADGTATPDQLEAAAQFFACAPEDLLTPERISAVLTRQGTEIRQSLRDIQLALVLPYTESQSRMDNIMAAAKDGAPLVQVLVTALGTLPFHKAKMETRLALLRTAVAVCHFRHAQGMLPSTLAELPAGVPLDPFTDSESFSYQLPEDGKGFTLGSKGTEKPQDSETLALNIILREP
jgi:hypothetical protein